MFQKISLEARYSKSFIFMLYALVLILSFWLGACLGSQPPEMLLITTSLWKGTEISVLLRFVTLFIPLCITLSVVAIGKAHLLLFVLFLKGVLFGIAVSGICAAFVFSGWLLCLLMLFSEIAGFTVYHWLWLRFLSGNGRLGRDSLICSIGLIAIFLFDFKIIHPFTAMLFNDL